MSKKKSMFFNQPSTVPPAVEGLPVDTILEAEDNVDIVSLSGGTLWGLGAFEAGHNGSGFLFIGSGDSNGTFSPTVGSRLDYVFDIPIDGDYYFHVRYFADNAGKDSFHIGFDEVYDATYNGLPSGTLQWEWFTITTPITLTAGIHTLNIWNRELGILLDQIEVTRNPVSQSAYDADSQLFINAIGTLTVAEEIAVNNLVTGLKANDTWNKHKAIYPFIGGTASAHKFNLKDPRDLDAAFRLDFNGTLTHSSNGVKGDGSTGYADTHFNMFLNSDDESHSTGVYINVDLAEGSLVLGTGVSGLYAFRPRATNNSSALWINGTSGAFAINPFNGDARGFYQFGRNSSTYLYYAKDGVITSENTGVYSTISTLNSNLYLFGRNVGGADNVSSNDAQLFYFAEALTAAELLNDHTVVQGFQTSLVRNMGTGITLPTNFGSYDIDTRKFIISVYGDGDTLTNIEADALDNLVLGLKANGTWTKHIAIYPFIGGTATSHKWNLKDPQDLDSAHRLDFFGTITHSATGALPDGSTGYADTHLYPAISSLFNDMNMCFYSRTNSESGTEFGSDDGAASGAISLSIKGNAFFGYYSMYLVNNDGNIRTSMNGVDSTGLFSMSRLSTTDYRVFRNGSQTGTQFNTNTGIIPPRSPYLFGSQLSSGTAANFGTRECAFFGVSSGLTGAEITNDYTTIQAYQTALGRQV